MSNKKWWYGIEGIEFHFRGPWADPEITYEGVTDSSCVDVEETLWHRYEDYLEEYPCYEPDDRDEGFASWVREDPDEVKYLIMVARGMEP